jgi:hypothetical protein
MKTAILAAAMVTIALAACGPKPIAFMKLNSPGTEGTLVENIELYYAHEKAPKNAQVIDHVEDSARNTNCKQAALIVLVRLQKKALGMGGNALINLKVIPKGKEEQSNAEGFWCFRSKALEDGGDLTQKIYEVTWEGDVARTVDSVEEEEPPAKKEEGGEGSSGSGESGGSGDNLDDF